jgi:hypothetical protein
MNCGVVLLVLVSLFCKANLAMEQVEAEMVVVLKNNRSVCSGFLMCNDIAVIPKVCLDNINCTDKFDLSPYSLLVDGIYEQSMLSEMACEEEEHILFALVQLETPYNPATGNCRKLV